MEYAANPFTYTSQVVPFVDNSIPSYPTRPLDVGGGIQISRHPTASVLTPNTGGTIDITFMNDYYANQPIPYHASGSPVSYSSDPVNGVGIIDLYQPAGAIPPASFFDDSLDAPWLSAIRIREFWVDYGHIPGAPKYASSNSLFATVAAMETVTGSANMDFGFGYGVGIQNIATSDPVGSPWVYTGTTVPIPPYWLAVMSYGGGQGFGAYMMGIFTGEDPPLVGQTPDVILNTGTLVGTGRIKQGATRIQYFMGAYEYGDEPEFPIILGGQFPFYPAKVQSGQGKITIDAFILAGAKDWVWDLLPTTMVRESWGIIAS